MLKIKKMTIFTKSVIFCLVCSIIAIVLLLITMKYVNTAGIDITSFEAGNVVDKAAYMCYQAMGNVFGFAAITASITNLFFAYYMFTLVLGSVVVLASFLLFWVSKMIMRIAG